MTPEMVAQWAREADAIIEHPYGVDITFSEDQLYVFAAKVAAHAALADGAHVVVPVEPTAEMLDAAYKAMMKATYGFEGNAMPAVYRAMIAARPGVK